MGYESRRSYQLRETEAISNIPPILVADVRRWLFEAALPLWAERGFDGNALFHEQLDFRGRPDLAVSRRMRVQARQLYVFNEAAAMGWVSPKPILEPGLDSFIRRCWSSDGEPGWVHLLSPAGEVVDSKRDAYDHAFALFALAAVHRQMGDPRARKLCEQTLAFMDDRLAHPAGGYAEGIPAAMPRRSNPHMHFLEAMLAWHAVTGEATFLDRANGIIDLFLRYFFDRRSGTYGEYFEDDLTRASAPAGLVVEPGHHFEWVWLLIRAAEAGGRDARPEAQRLYEFALAHGLDGAGLAVDECDPSGRQTRRTRRSWPQTELIKAHVAMGDVEQAAVVAQNMLDTYLDTDVQGLWMDQFDEDGRGITQAVPASTFYHLMVAFRELMTAARAA